MYILLILNTIFELAVPTGMLLNPAFFYPKFTSELLPLTRLYALILAGVGCLGLILLINGGRNTAGLIALTIFHSLIALGQFLNWRQKFIALPVVIGHVIFALGFLLASLSII